MAQKKVTLSHVKDTANCSVFQAANANVVRAPVYLDKKLVGGAQAVTITVDIAA